MESKEIFRYNQAMRESDVLGIFKKEKALLEGHFLLSSGLHSGGYLQCALVLQRPDLAEKLCRALAQKISKLKPQVVIGPALGGVVVSYEMARALKVRSLFAERLDGTLALRRGFSLKKNEKALVVEDVVTTGKSTREVVAIVESYGAKVVGIASIVDRSDGQAGFAQPFESLLAINIETNSPENCPLCREGKVPAVKPGSRG